MKSDSVLKCSEGANSWTQEYMIFSEQSSAQQNQHTWEAHNAAVSRKLKTKLIVDLD